MISFLILTLRLYLNFNTSMHIYHLFMCAFVQAIYTVLRTEMELIEDLKMVISVSGNVCSYKLMGMQAQIFQHVLSVM